MNNCPKLADIKKLRVNAIIIERTGIPTSECVILLCCIQQGKSLFVLNFAYPQKMSISGAMAPNVDWVGYRYWVARKRSDCESRNGICN
jgi:hypothetical protein